VSVSTACRGVDDPASLGFNQISNEVIRELVKRFGHSDVVRRATDVALQESAQVFTAPHPGAYDVSLQIRRFWLLGVGAMWQALSGRDKKRVSFCVVMLAAMVVVIFYFAVSGYWIVAAAYTFAVAHLAFLLYVKVIKPALAEARQPRAIIPDPPA
jgi:hypothetical protein